MNSWSLVKKDLLRRKIKEHFSRNPDSNSATFKMESAGEKTYWKVIRESDKKTFSIVEVASKINQFLIEQTLTEFTPVEDPEQQDATTPNPDDPNALNAVPPQPQSARSATVSTVPTQNTVAQPQAQQQTQQQPQANQPSAPAVDPNASPPADPQQDPTTTAVTPAGGTGDPWDPGNPQGQFANLVTQVGLDNALKAMPQDKYAQFFGATQGQLKPGATYGNALQDPRIPPESVQLAHKVPLAEASGEFTSISRQFQTALTPPFDKQKIASAMTSIQSNFRHGGIEDPFETTQASLMIAVLQFISKAITPASQQLSAHKSVKGKKIHEQEFIPDNVEEMSFAKSLEGQTISSATTSGENGKFEIDINLVTTDFPARITFEKGGRILYTFKDVPYLLQKKWI